MTAKLPFFLMQRVTQWSLGLGSIVHRNAEINEQLTPAWKEWSEFKFLQKLKS